MSDSESYARANNWRIHISYRICRIRSRKHSVSSLFHFYEKRAQWHLWSCSCFLAREFFRMNESDTQNYHVISGRYVIEISLPFFFFCEPMKISNPIGMDGREVVKREIETFRTELYTEIVTNTPQRFPKFMYVCRA